MSQTQDEAVEQTTRGLTRRETPSVLAAFKSLKRGQQELKLRILRYSKGEPILDIREFVKSQEFNGFTRKGIALTYEQVCQLESLLPEIKTALEEEGP